MLGKDSNRRLPRSLKKAIAALSFSALVATLPVSAQDSKPNHNNFFFWPGNLVVSRSVYSSTNTWNLVYTLQAGLGLGVPYTVRNYPTGNDVATGLPWTPATDGLRNITGAVYPFGYVGIWGITSTISGNGDQGADPNQLVVVFDSLSNTDPAVAARESFFTVRKAGFGEVLRGISFTPGTFHDDDRD
jgi:hypothetical protein